VEAPALYIREGDAYVPTILTQGGWDPRNANGAAVLALIGQVLDGVPTLVPMTVSRFTADLARPVPIGMPMYVDHEVMREGKKIQIVELRMRAADGTEHVRVTVLRLREADVSSSGVVPPSTTDEQPAAGLRRPEELVSLQKQARDAGAEGGGAGMIGAFDMRRVRRPDRPGMFWWLRLEADVVAGEATRPTARMTFAFDFANLIGIEPQIAAVTLINPDVSAHVLRAPRGEWVAVTGDTRFEPAMGRGMSVATLSDHDGVFATATTSCLIQPR
jgi:hypothetical protein